MELESAMREKDERIKELELKLNSINSEQDKQKALFEQQLVFKEESLKQLSS